MKIQCFLYICMLGRVKFYSMYLVCLWVEYRHIIALVENLIPRVHGSLKISFSTPCPMVTCLEIAGTVNSAYHH